MLRSNTPRHKNKGVYILTNTVNSKQYVGTDSNMPQRFKQHIRGTAKCALLHEALTTVGLEKWTVQFIPYPGIRSINAKISNGQTTRRVRLHPTAEKEKK